MSGFHLRNIEVKTLRLYLEWKGMKHYRTKGGHEVWGRSDLSRPIVFQTHITPVPEFIIKQILRNLGEDREDFIRFLQS